MKIEKWEVWKLPNGNNRIRVNITKSTALHTIFNLLLGIFTTDKMWLEAELFEQ